jgi:hypothetical protein
MHTFFFYPPPTYDSCLNKMYLLFSCTYFSWLCNLCHCVELVFLYDLFRHLFTSINDSFQFILSSFCFCNYQTKQNYCQCICMNIIKIRSFDPLTYLFDPLTYFRFTMLTYFRFIMLTYFRFTLWNENRWADQRI